MTFSLKALRGLRSVFGEDTVAAIRHADSAQLHTVLALLCWSVALIDADELPEVVRTAIRTLCKELRAARNTRRNRSTDTVQ